MPENEKIILELERQKEFFEGEIARLQTESILEDSPLKKYRFEKYKDEAVNQIESIKKALNVLKEASDVENSSVSLKLDPLVDKITEIINQYLQAASDRHHSILIKKVSHLSIEFRDANSVDSSTFIISLGNLYADSLKKRFLEAWHSTKNYLEKQNVCFGTGQTDVLKKAIADLVDYKKNEQIGEFKKKYKDLLAHHHQSSKAINDSFDSTQNQIFSKISADLNVYLPLENNTQPSSLKSRKNNMNKTLFNTLKKIADNKGIMKLAGEKDEDYEAFENITLQARELHKLGFVNFDESKGKVIVNSRNHKSQYHLFMCKVEYTGKQVLEFKSYEEYEKSLTPIATNDMKTNKIFISHSEKDMTIAEKTTDYLLSALDINEEIIRCTSVPGYKLKFGNLSKLLKQDISDKPIIIVIITPNSLKSKWVMFELGASWIKDLTIIPLIAPSLSYKDIPGPLDGHTSIEFRRENPDIASQLTEMVNQISREKELKQKNTGRTDKEKQGLIDEYKRCFPVDDSLLQLGSVELDIISSIISIRAFNDESNSINIARKISYSTAEIILAHLNRMHDMKLVTFHSGGQKPDQETSFFLTSEATKYVLNQKEELATKML